MFFVINRLVRAIFSYIKFHHARPAKMGQQLRVLTAHVEDLSLLPST